MPTIHTQRRRRRWAAAPVRPTPPGCLVAEYAVVGGRGAPLTEWTTAIASYTRQTLRRALHAARVGEHPTARLHTRPLGSDSPGAPVDVIAEFGLTGNS